MGDSSDSEEFYDAEEFTPNKGSKRSSICKNISVKENSGAIEREKSPAAKVDDQVPHAAGDTGASTAEVTPPDDRTTLKNVVQGRRRFQELRRCMQTEEEEDAVDGAGAADHQAYALEQPFKVIAHDTMSLQSMTSLGRIGRILSGASESHPNIRDSAPAASLSSREPSTISDDPLPSESRTQNVLAMAEPDVIASTKANSLKQRAPAAAVVAVSGAAPAAAAAEPRPAGAPAGPVAPPRRKKRNKLHGSQSLSTTDGDNLSICTTDTDDYRYVPRRVTDKQHLDSLLLETPASHLVLNQSMSLPSPASTIESLTREFQDSLELSHSKYVAMEKSHGAVRVHESRASGSSRGSTSGSGSASAGRRPLDSTLDIRDACRGEYVVRAQDEARTLSEGRAHAHAHHPPAAGHSSLGSATRRSNSEGMGGMGAEGGARRRSAGDETQLALGASAPVRTRTTSGHRLTDMEILEQVTVLNLDTGERVPLSIAEHKLPQCINPLSLHIMRLTSEYIGRANDEELTSIVTDVEAEVIVPKPKPKRWHNRVTGLLRQPTTSPPPAGSCPTVAETSPEVAREPRRSWHKRVSVSTLSLLRRRPLPSAVSSTTVAAKTNPEVAREPRRSWHKRVSGSTLSLLRRRPSPSAVSSATVAAKTNPEATTKPKPPWLKQLSGSTWSLGRRARRPSPPAQPAGSSPSVARTRETDEESESVCAGGAEDDTKETKRESTDRQTTAIRRKTEKLKRFFGSTVKKTVDAAKSLAQEVSHARHKEDVADIADEVRGEHNIKLKASNSHKGPYDFDGCVRHVQEMSEHDGAVWCCKFSVCGRLLATAGQDKLLRTWVTRDAYHMFQDMRTKYNAEQKSSPTPSQESLASFTAPPPPDDAPLGPAAPFCPKPFCVYSGHTSDLLDVSWSKNYFLLSSSMDKTVRLWHISRGECLCCFQHIDFVTAIVFHPRDDRYFLSGSLDGKLRLWNIPDKKVAVWNEVDGKTKLITAANFCQNGKFAVVGTYDGRCIFYTTDQLKYHTQIDVRSTRGKNKTGRKISGIEPMPNDDKILVTSNDSRIRLYDLRDLNLSCKYKGYVNVSSQIKASFSHDGKYIVSGSENQCIYIWKTYHDYSKFSSVRRDRNDYWEGIKAHNVVVTCAVFAPNPEHMIRTLQEREEMAAAAARRPDERDDVKEKSADGGMVASTQTGHVLVSADFNGCIKVFVHKSKTKHSSLPASALT